VKACLKSKCDEVSCCCIKIHRNIEAEEDEHKFDVEHKIKTQLINLIYKLKIKNII
jgi:hypothetical protein